MTVLDIQAQIGKAVDEMAHARKAQTDIMDRVGADPDTGAIRLEDSADKAAWAKADGIIEAQDVRLKGLRADLVIEQHRGEAEDLERARDAAARNRPGGRGSNANPPASLGQVIKRVSAAGGERLRLGEFTLPIVDVMRDQHPDYGPPRNAPLHSSERWTALDDAGAVLGENLAGDQGLVSDVDRPTMERLDITTADVPGGIAIGTLPVQKELFDNAELLGQCKVLNTMSGTKLKRRTRGKIAGADNTTPAGAAILIDEGAALTEKDPTYGQKDQDAYKIGHRTDLTYETIMDLTPGSIEAELRSDMGVALALGIDHYIAVGTDNNQPEGVFTPAAIERVTGATSGAGPTAQEIIDTKYKVGSGYTNRRWCTLFENLAHFRKLAIDSDAANPLFRVDQTGRWNGYLDGEPVITSPGCKPWAAGANQVLVYGDFRRLEVRFAGPLRIKRSTEVGWTTDTVAWAILQRFDSVVLDENAFSIFQCKA